MQALAAAIEERDNYTHEHTQELVRLSRGVSMMLGLDSGHVERIAHAALLVVDPADYSATPWTTAGRPRRSTDWNPCCM